MSKYRTTYTKGLVVEVVHHDDGIFAMHEHPMKFRQIGFLSHQEQKANLRKYYLSAHISVVDFDCIVMGIVLLGWFSMVDWSIAPSSNLLNYS